jgi:hypothetical protein
MPQLDRVHPSPGRPRPQVHVSLVGLAAAVALVLIASPQVALGYRAPYASGTGTSGSGDTSVSAAAASAAVYGSAINADSLNNSVVGGPGNREVSYRFRATTSSQLASVRVYIIGPAHSGYGAGTGGTWRVTVETDDGTAGHAPSGTVLASTTFAPVEDFPVIGWSSPASLTAGRLYHVVFRNIDPNPEANYASLDGLYTYADLSRWQPRFTNVGWANLVKSRGSWSDERGHGNGTITPIMQLRYANGTVAGLGYMEVWVRTPKVISGGHKVREVFTVRTGTRRVSSVSVRLKRIGGSSALRVRLKTSSGKVVAKGRIRASKIATGRGSWVTLKFATSHRLVKGRSYRLVLTSRANTRYSIFVIRQGSSYGFASQTYFGDGFAQYTPGTGWVGFDQPGGARNSRQGDLQFYFR